MSDSRRQDENSKAPEPEASPALEEGLDGGPPEAGTGAPGFGGAEDGDSEPAAAEDPLAIAQAEAARLKEQLLRTAADFDNFRKRSKREISEAVDQGREGLLKELLPVFDNLERAQEHAKEATEVASLADGVGLVTRQFLDTLGRLGIERVDARGQAFDPSLHEAIQQIESTEHQPGEVAAQVQAGYKLGARLIRPAMVVVAKAPAARAPASAPPAGVPSETDGLAGDDIETNE